MKNTDSMATLVTLHNQIAQKNDGVCDIRKFSRLHDVKEKC